MNVYVAEYSDDQGAGITGVYTSKALAIEACKRLADESIANGSIPEEGLEVWVRDEQIVVSSPDDGIRETWTVYEMPLVSE